VKKFIMNKENKLNLRICVQNLLAQHPDWPLSRVVKSMKELGYKKSTIYDIIKRLKAGSDLEDQLRSGRPRVITSPIKPKIQRKAKNRKAVSIRKIAKEFEISPSSAHRILKSVGIVYRKRRKRPQYSDEDIIKIRQKALRLYRRHLVSGCAVVMDDEIYFGLKNDEDPANSGFYTDDIKKTPPSIKYKTQKKYPTKVLLWITISERGCSRPFIIRRKSVSMNADHYLNECIKPILTEFLRKYHSDGNYIFWPDLASAHYAKKVINWMNENGINFVPKEDNPPNVPQARPIETFWSHISQKIYEGGWEAKSINQLIRRIHFIVRRDGHELCKRTFNDVKSIVREIGRKGPLTEKANKY